MIKQALHTLFLLHLATSPATAADKRVLAFGDSNTVGIGDTDVVCPTNHTTVGGYPPRLRSRLAARGLDAEILNFGLCGELTTTGITRVESVLAAGGDVIVIMEGTNDISRGISLETIGFNLSEMARKAEGAGIEPLLASVIPQGPETNDADNVLTRDLALQLEAATSATGRVFADPFHAFFDLPNFFERFYFNQLHPSPAGYGILADSMVSAAIDAATRNELCAQVPPGPCVASGTTLCLNQGRFRLDIVWQNFSGQVGTGQAVPQTDDTGAFFFFDPQNIEMTVKVLDGRLINGHFWVFYGALSNVEFSLAVTDTETGGCKQYDNPLGTFASVGDIEAF